MREFPRLLAMLSCLFLATVSGLACWRIGREVSAYSWAAPALYWTTPAKDRIRYSIGDRAWDSWTLLQPLTEAAQRDQTVVCFVSRVEIGHIEDFTRLMSLWHPHTLQTVLDFDESWRPPKRRRKDLTVYLLDHDSGANAAFEKHCQLIGTVGMSRLWRWERDE